MRRMMDRVTKRADGRPGSGSRRMAPDAFLERFGEAGVILLADRDLMLRVNGAAADLFEEARRVFGTGPFGAAALTSLLGRRYRLAPAAAARRAASLLRGWTRLGIFIPAPGGGT